MTNQLVLIENPTSSWRLDDATRAVGRRGLAEARATLRAARLRASLQDPASIQDAASSAYDSVGSDAA